MYGCNYETFFGIDVFGDCKTLDEFYGQLKLGYKALKPEATELVSFNKIDIWKEVDFALHFVATGLTVDDHI